MSADSQPLPRPCQWASAVIYRRLALAFAVLSYVVWCYVSRGLWFPGTLDWPLEFLDRPLWLLRLPCMALALVFIILALTFKAGRDLKATDRLFATLFSLDLVQQILVGVTVFFLFFPAGFSTLPTLLEWYTARTLACLLGQVVLVFTLYLVVIFSFFTSKAWAKWVLAAFVAASLVMRLWYMEPDGPAYHEMLERISNGSDTIIMRPINPDDGEETVIDREILDDSEPTIYPEPITFALYAIALVYAFLLRERFVEVPAEPPAP